MTKTEHFTAWLTTDKTMVEGDHMDVVVLADRDATEFDDERGPNWVSTGDPLFHAETGVDVHTGDDADAMREAVEILDDDGWIVEGDWAAVDSGYTVTVSHV